MASIMIDMTLPRTSSPAMVRFRDMPMRVLPVAVYLHTTVDVEALLQACNSQLDTSMRDIMRLAPHSDFFNQPLHASYDYHIGHVAPRSEFDPFHFIAVVGPHHQQSSVILAALDADGSDDECQVDKLVVQPPQDVGLVIVNLQIGNCDWEDYKEQYGDGSGDSDDSDDGNEQGDDSESKKVSTDDYYSDGATKAIPSMGFWIGLYAVNGIDFDQLMKDLCFYHTTITKEEIMTRPEGHVSESTAVEEASRLHPLRCRDNRGLYRTMFLVADTFDYKENGLTLVKLHWDGVVENKTSAELSTTGDTAKKEVQRLATSASETTTNFLMIARGYRPWKLNHWAFLVYGGRGVDEFAVIEVLDPKSEKRTSGTEWFLHGKMLGSGVVGVPVDVPSSVRDPRPWETALRYHPPRVYVDRFTSTVNRQYFVYCDQQIESPENEVTLARMEWDGAVEGKSPTELGGMYKDVAAKVATQRCPAGEAYKTLVALADGKETWTGS